MLKTWRTETGRSLAQTARDLGIVGVNPGATLARIEIGSRQPDADMVERIVRLTGGAVTAADMHAIRLAWLREHRPDKFSGLPDAPGLAAADAASSQAGIGTFPEAAE